MSVESEIIQKIRGGTKFFGSLSSIILSHLILYPSSPLSKPRRCPRRIASDNCCYVRKFARNLVPSGAMRGG